MSDTLQKLYTKFRPLASCIAGVSFITLTLMQRHFGFALILVMLFWLPWLFYSIYIMGRHPPQRTLRGAKIAIWLTGFAIIIAGHIWMASVARQYANQAVASIEQYRQEKGHYPPDSATAGLSRQWLRKHLGTTAYGINEGKPYFVYASTYIVFDLESYDFSNGQWQHIND
ncbi:hypothetical protein [Undibacterium sp. TJN19]|uniref:hypothetical protein n=1 Tax=Undibacterium sp. TJN19 TaxID=3413055 RepID=UPI003BF0F142